MQCKYKMGLRGEKNLYQFMQASTVSNAVAGCTTTMYMYLCGVSDKSNVENESSDRVMPAVTGTCGH